MTDIITKKHNNDVEYKRKDYKMELNHIRRHKNKNLYHQWVGG